jgi:hypothetical protein
MKKAALTIAFGIGALFSPAMGEERKTVYTGIRNGVYFLATDRLQMYAEKEIFYDFGKDGVLDAVCTVDNKCHVISGRNYAELPEKYLKIEVKDPEKILDFEKRFDEIIKKFTMPDRKQNDPPKNTI